MKSFAFALIFAVISSAYKVNVIDDVDSWKLEHPKFNLTGPQPKDHSYQARRYAAAKWASTPIQELTEEKAKKVGFLRLFDYIRGANDRGIKLDMTVPVVTGITASSCVFCRTNYTMSIYIPSIYQDNPPMPTNKDVYIMPEAAMIFYVKEFSGFARPDVSKSVAHQLSLDLQRNNVTKNEVESNHMYIAEYNRSFRRWHRHNEIWLRRSSGNVTFDIDGFAFDKDPYIEQDEREFELL